MSLFRFIVGFLLCLLTACGGGGGGGSSMTMAPTVPQQPVMPMPEQPMSADSPVTVTQTREAGVAAADVFAYLSANASGGPWNSGPEFMWEHPPGLVRYPNLPTVRIAQGASPHERAVLHHVVALINRELPYDQHLQIGPDAPALAPIEDVPLHQIFVDFAPPAQWNDPNAGLARPGSLGIAQLDETQAYDAAQGRFEKQSANRAHLWLSPQEAFAGDQELLSVLMHELVHVLGMAGHLDEATFPSSVMRDLTLLLTDRLPAIDGAALWALYSRLGLRTEPEELTAVSDLGPWDDEASVLRGQLGDLTFGVTTQNGVSRPWTAGALPTSALADNAALRGTVTWSGGLVGVTPEQEVVRGETAISVGLDTLTGRADFTQLQSWAGAPGEWGTGTRWNTGTLGYDLAVSGNYLRSTGGDDGDVNGAFYGAAHETVAGALERADLTAAFGASR